jgi:hypothetical protein
MLDNLLKHLKEEIAPKLQQSAQITEDQATQAATVSHEMIGDTIKNHIADGNSSTLLNMLSGTTSETANHPMTHGLTNNVISEIAGRLGIDKSKAQNIASTIVPSALNFLNSAFVTSKNESTPEGLTKFLGLEKDAPFMDKVKGIADKIGLGSLFGSK